MGEVGDQDGIFVERERSDRYVKPDVRATAATLTTPSSIAARFGRPLCAPAELGQIRDFRGRPQDDIATTAAVPPIGSSTRNERLAAER
jgi:hypothetical protein